MSSSLTPAPVQLARADIADMVLTRLRSERESLRAAYRASSDGIGHFVVDDVLPADVARAIRAAFPPPSAMTRKKTLREYKYVAAQMDRYDPLLEEAVFAFQDPRIVELMGDITGIGSLQPDEHLYAGGISAMGPGQYLNPHVDNSHDKDRARWRVLNLLYYVTEDWVLENGGNLELWPDGLKQPGVTIHSRFNRLAVMATHDASWHSVSPVAADGLRCCVSNYYFSDEPLRDSDRFHVTSFRGRPEQPLTDKVLQVDALLRSGVRKVLSQGLGNKDHVYRRPGENDRE